MSSIKNLLNPTGNRGGGEEYALSILFYTPSLLTLVRHTSNQRRSEDVSQSPMSTSGASTGSATEQTPRTTVKKDTRYTDHEPHPNCPDSLACLPDTDGRPQHTLPVILRCAILGSSKKRLTIREIYGAMEDKYAYFRTAGPTWKVSQPLVVLRLTISCFTAAIRSPSPLAKQVI